MAEYKQACATKAKRTALAARVAELAERYGASVALITDSTGVSLAAVIYPYSVSMRFDGCSRVDAFLGYWCAQRGRRFPADFYVAIRGSTDPYYHGSKATTCADTFEGFLASLEAGFKRLRELTTAEAA